MLIFRFLSFTASLRVSFAAHRSQNVFTDHDLEYFIAEREPVLVAFSSRKFEPVQSFHRTLENISNDQRIHTTIVAIDCDVKEELCAKYDVNEYPVIRLFKTELLGNKERTMRRYRGPKTEHAIRSFLTKHENAIISDVGSQEKLSQFKNIDDIVIVAFLTGEWDTAKEIFYSIADKHHEDYVFGYSDDKASAEREGVTVPSIICYKNTDGDHKVLKGPFTEEDVESFLQLASKMVIGDFNERNMEEYMAPGKLSVYIFAATEEEATVLRHELTPLAKNFEQYCTFGVADAVEYGPMAKNFGLKDEGFPALAVHAPMNDNVFTYLQGRKITAKIVEDMLMTILQGGATSGQVFGQEALEMEGTEAEREIRERNEL